MSSVIEISNADLAAAAATCACSSVRRAARAVTQFYDNALAPSGIGIAQFGLLTAIKMHGDSTRTDLARSLVMDRTTLARNLKLLEREGLIESVAGDDKRVRAVALTNNGREAWNRAAPFWKQAQRHLMQEMGESRWLDMRSGLGALEELYQPQ